MNNNQYIYNQPMMGQMPLQTIEGECRAMNQMTNIEVYAL